MALFKIETEQDNYYWCIANNWTDAEQKARKYIEFCGKKLPAITEDRYGTSEVNKNLEKSNNISAIKLITDELIQ
jgi:hypothetical protein